MFTKEEWVRQSWLNYLIEVMKYPASLIAVEKEIHLGELKKRFDIVVFSNFLPWMIIECKEMNTSINEDTVKQVMIYNIRLKAPFMIISNGKNTIGVLIKEGRIYRLSSLPLIQ
ncbi:MAG: type I restriction enzyme HsdR N-terminal domain-containing protein [Sediminibacterium sp.]|nr:type I restriction enzyme HsdR N-terminal domain-containing protein [Sediminibacterium sp.]MDP3392600.1 type I restriction enzyme HsdR N-terminal domain-containing protein [Sediminibacterium sp.]